MNWAQWLDLCSASVDVAAFGVGVVFGAAGLYLLALARKIP